MNKLSEVRSFLDEGILKVLEVSASEAMLSESLQDQVPFLTYADPLAPAAEQETRGSISVIPYAFLDEDCYFGRFELLFSVDSFHLFSRPQVELLQLRRLIHKGGRILIIDREDPENGYTPESITKKLEKSGFLDIQSRSEDGEFLISGVK